MLVYQRVCDAKLKNVMEYVVTSVKYVRIVKHIRGVRIVTNSCLFHRIFLHFHCDLSAKLLIILII